MDEEQEEVPDTRRSRPTRAVQSAAEGRSPSGTGTRPHRCRAHATIPDSQICSSHAPVEAYSAMTTTSARESAVRSAPTMADEPGVSVIGLGKLGSPMAACFAAKGSRRSASTSTRPRRGDRKRPRTGVRARTSPRCLGRARRAAATTDRGPPSPQRRDVRRRPDAERRRRRLLAEYVLPACEAIGVRSGRRAATTSSCSRAP